MPIKGTDIVKKLPEAGKKNCRECGFPTCFAFAMKLATGGIKVDKCPYLSSETKAELEDALAPPIKPITIGSGINALTIGEEEVMYRHEKTFIHSPGIALLISDKEDEAKVTEKINKIQQLKFDWVGLTLKANLLALYFESGDESKFKTLVKKVYQTTDLGMILISEDTNILFVARDLCADRKPLIYPITEKNSDTAIPRIKQAPTPVGVRGKNIEELIPLTSKLKDAGVDDMVLDPGSQNLSDIVRDQTFLRRAALKQSFKPLRYPTMTFPCFLAKDGRKEILFAATSVAKYAGIIVLSNLERFSLLPLLVHRLNIYTDPRKPLTVESKIYEINTPNEMSPVVVTTNFALTYFAVSSETEGSKVPAFLCIKDTEGLCVLAAWSTGKFSGDTVAPFIKKCGIADRVKHHRLIIPGLASRIKGELEDELPGWEIIVGPREASEIPNFLPALVEKWKG